MTAAQSRAERGARIAWRELDGVVLLDKPAGPSSTAVLQRVRRVLRAAKAGHAGTLDPLATGMLPLCFGQATKSCGTLLGGAKAYTVGLALGTATDTADAAGRSIATAPVPVSSADAVEAALAGLRGPQLQVPPMHSALKQDGRRLYEHARAGRTVERAPRPIEVYSIHLLRCDAARVDFSVECSTGTYVRVLGEDLARRLGTVGHLAALRRDWVAPFQGRPMVTPEAIEAWAAQDRPTRPDWLMPVDAGLDALPSLRVDPATETALLQGRTIAAPAGAAASGVRVYSMRDGAFLGVLTGGEPGRLRVQRLYVDPAARLRQPEAAQET